MGPSNPFGTDLPIVAAPMAGGGTTAALVTAATAAGAFAFLPAGYKAPEPLAADIVQLHSQGVAFGVNLFAPGPNVIGEAAFRAYARELQPEADPYGLDLNHAPLRHDDDYWREKIDLLLARPVPVVSVVFGLPPAADLDALHRVGTKVLVTVTTPEEARSARDAGADGLVAQGTDAGGHSGTHDLLRPVTPTDTADLVRSVVATTGLPVVAAGGVDGPARVHQLMAAGASAVAVGTLLLRTDESGASDVHKRALADPAFTETVMTRAFTGRLARGLRNGFINRHQETAPQGYPAIHHLTRELRQAAARAGNADQVHLWAGTGYRKATTGPAAQVISTLASAL